MLSYGKGAASGNPIFGLSMTSFNFKLLNTVAVASGAELFALSQPIEVNKLNKTEGVKPFVVI